MRPFRISPLLAIAGLAAASIGSPMAAAGEHPGAGRRARRRTLGFVPAWMNRHTGEPHEHKREIARRLRQAKSL